MRVFSRISLYRILSGCVGGWKRRSGTFSWLCGDLLLFSLIGTISDFGASQRENESMDWIFQHTIFQNNAGHALFFDALRHALAIIL